MQRYDLLCQFFLKRISKITVDASVLCMKIGDMIYKNLNVARGQVQIAQKAPSVGVG